MFFCNGSITDFDLQKIDIFMNNNKVLIKINIHFFRLFNYLKVASKVEIN